MKIKKCLTSGLLGLLVLMVALPLWTYGQSAGGEAQFRQEELDQLLAPVALYPDSLLIQILMAATYPLEVVEAGRWQKANARLQGDQMAAALEEQNWDPSVKSLIAFPSVLGMMDEKLDWTQRVGDAFLAQKDDVMDAVQRLREKAQEAGYLKTTREQKVVVEEKIIRIEPAQPEVIYVPAYDPVVVYGPWWYPAYPPFVIYPVGVVFTPGVVFGFTTGFFMGGAWGPAWGYAWGGFGWRNHDVDINIYRNVNFNRYINRNVYRDRWNIRGEGPVRWDHDRDHRRGVAYRDARTRERYDRSDRRGVDSRRDYRGFDQGGRERIQGRDRPVPVPHQEGVSARKPVGQVGRPGIEPRRERVPDRKPAVQRDRSKMEQPERSHAFEGIGRGSNVRQESLRGQQSRGSMPARERSSGGHGTDAGPRKK